MRFAELGSFFRTIKSRSYTSCIVSILCFFLCSTTNQLRADFEKRFIIDYSDSVDVRSDFYDFSFVDFQAEIILPRQDQGKIIASLRTKELKRRWEERQEKLIKDSEISFSITNLEVQRWIFELVEEIKGSEKGYDGVFLEFLDIGTKSDEALGPLSRKFSDHIRKIWHEAYIILPCVEQIPVDQISSVDGALIKGWKKFYDSENQSLVKRSKKKLENLKSKLLRIKEQGQSVFLADYIDDGDTVSTVREKCEKMSLEGFYSFFTEPSFQGIDYLFSPMKRTVLSLYGKKPRVGGYLWAEDTDIQSILSVPFEWRGYEMDHHSILEDGVPPFASDIAAIAIDNACIIKGNNELPFLQLIADAVKRGIKVYCLGSLPIMSSSAFGDFLQLLELEGNQAFYFPKTELNTRGDLNQIPSYEIDFRIKTNAGLLNVYSLEHSPILLEGESTDGKRFLHSPFVFSPKVAIWQSPHVSILNPEDNSMLMADPFWFIDKSLNPEIVPIPDTTTLYGARIFFSQIDGDGLLNFSQIKPGARSGEVIRDDILKKYPFPVTASIIVSEVAGDTVVYKERFQNEFTDLAQSIFQLDNIEVSSHTYSHPYFWSYEDVEMSLFYKSRHLKLNKPYEFDYEKETIESLEYIRDLIGGSKETKLILWSGNCRPPAKLLKKLNAHGYYNINGGNTVISKRFPYHTHISPKCIFWRGGFQVYAAIQNENVFNNEFNNNRFAGFINVLDTFDKTESPRRLKPIDLYYHFYSADRTDSFVALKKILNEIEATQIYPIWGSEFYKIVEDSYFARFSMMGKNRFFVKSSGAVRTYRIPVSSGLYPDLTDKQDVVGFKDYQGQRYLFTNGRGNPVIALTNEEPRNLFLEYCDVTIESIELNKNTLFIKTGPQWIRECKVHFRMNGVKDLYYQINENEEKRVQANQNGLFEIRGMLGDSSLKIWAKMNIK